MIFLSLESWFVGLTSLILVIWGFIWGILFIYQGKKSNAKLLIYWGIYWILGWLTYGGVAIDFLTILVTGRNTSRILVFSFFHILSFNWIFALLVVANLLTPKKKWFFIIFFLISAIFYELTLFLAPLNFVYLEFPVIPGDEVVSPVAFGPVGNYVLFGVTFLTFLGGLGLIYKGTISQGIIRKKYFYFGTAIFLANFPAILDVVLFLPLSIIAIIMIFQLISSGFCYLGLRREPEEHKKKIKKDVKVKDSLFLITQRPDRITEEEVTYYREQKICLMCKGKVGGFNTYICKNCEAIYHENCARTLSDLENACWVCNEPIDETKPTKPFKIAEQIKGGSILEIEENNSDKEKKNLKKME